MNQFLIGTMTFYFGFVIFLMFFMFFRRKARVKNKEVRTSHFKAYIGESPEDLVVIQNHFTNQFQIPVVYMIACVLTISQDKASVLTSILGAIFILSRMLHSYIHLGKNNVLHRAYAYFVGCLCVLGLLMVNLI